MNRRSVLTLVGSGGISLVAGCSGDSGCPELDLENQPSYEIRIIERGGPVDVGIDMLTSQDGIDDFVWEYLTDDDERWIAETDFDRSAVIRLHYRTGGSNNSDFEVLGVEWESDRVLHAYSCIAEVGGADAGNLYTRLLRVSYENEPPDEGRYTHWDEGDGRTYETSE